MPSETPKPRGRPKDADLCNRRICEILKAATKAFAANGYRATDMQTIADHAGVSKGTIYLYFKNKEELFLATVRAGVDWLSTTIQASYDVDQVFAERLPRAIHAYLRFFDENPELVELIMQERAEFRDRKQSTYFEHKATRAAEFAREIQADIDAGRLRNIPAQRIHDVLGDLLYGTIFANHFRGRIKSLEDQAEDILDILKHGIYQSDPSV